MKKTHLIIVILFVALIVSNAFLWIEVKDAKKEMPDQSERVNSLDVEVEQAQDVETKDSNFALNQSCLQYKGELEEKLKEKKPPLGSASYLEQIFYSPKQGSCLYVRYDDSGNDLKNFVNVHIRNLYDIRDDGYSSHPLEQCIVAARGDNCDEFEAKLEEYKM